MLHRLADPTPEAQGGTLYHKTFNDRNLFSSMVFLSQLRRPTVTMTQAYYDTNFITIVKSFIIQALELAKARGNVKYFLRRSLPCRN